jgi:CheY-like chemotaxis protein
MVTTVLIVDDSKLARIVVGKVVSGLQPDWQRIEAGNADEALAVLDAQPVDLAIVDFNMPGRNGLDLAEELRRRFPPCRSPSRRRMSRTRSSPGRGPPTPPSSRSP